MGSLPPSCARLSLTQQTQSFVQVDPARKKAKVEMFEQVHKLETLINEGPCSGHEAVWGTALCQGCC